MDKNHTLRVSKKTIETTTALLDQLEVMSKAEAFHFNNQVQAIIKTVRGILLYENSDWDDNDRFNGLVAVIDGLLRLLPFDYSINKQAVIVKYLNSALQFDPDVRDLVAKHYGLKRMKNRAFPTWEKGIMALPNMIQY